MTQNDRKLLIESLNQRMSGLDRKDSHQNDLWHSFHKLYEYHKAILYKVQADQKRIQALKQITPVAKNQLKPKLDKNGKEIKPRGSLRRAPEVLRVAAMIPTDKIGEYLHRTIVLSADGNIYKYKNLTKEPCTADFDWSRYWELTNHKGRLSDGDWLELMKSEGWFIPIYKEKSQRALVPLSKKRVHRAKIRTEGTGYKPNPLKPGTKIGITSLADIIKSGTLDGSRSMRATFNKMKKDPSGI